MLQVFIRELISNASDAIEKLRYLQLTGTTGGEADSSLEIHIATDEAKKTFIIQVRFACHYVCIIKAYTESSLLFLRFNDILFSCLLWFMLVNKM